MGKGAGTFLSNAGVLQVFGVNDVESAELVTRTIGKMGVRYSTGSWSNAWIKRNGSTTEHMSGRD
jgi:type IV secretion system protein VirD4